MKSRHRAAAGLLAGLLASLPAAAFDLQGHRGARGLAPENTLPAFERALAIGVTTLELDVGITADGVVVVAHDPGLNPALTRDASGRWLARPGPRLRDLRLAQLQAYDVGRMNPASSYARAFPEQQAVDGTRIPTLAQVFARVRELGAWHVRFNIETKLGPADDIVAVERLTDAVLQQVRAAGVGERVTIQSFDWRSLRRSQQVEPSIRTSYLTVQTANSDSTLDGTWTAGLRLDDHGSVPRMVKAAYGRAWSPNAGALTQALVEEAHQLGLQVLPWTVNDPALMERLLGWGVDGIITDHPERLRAVLQRHGVELPPPVR
jgi:glycerophosphoryl diester phosphodiesterase